MRVILLFQNTKFVIGAEKRLNSIGIQAKILPTPTSVSEHCGMALSIEQEKIDDACNILRNNNIKFTLYEE